MKTHAFHRLAFPATCFAALSLLVNGLASLALAQASSAAPRRFAVEGGRFTLDGKPVQIISGEMHYPRIPRPYWRERFRMAKAMGLNTITTYVFWNVHEPQPGVYDFSGNLDVAEYIREAQQEGLSVILRPGPYVCAEWEFGGFPAWLLKDPKLVVRSRDEKFLAATSRWFTRLGQEVASLQVGNGRPIIAVQVENEYGSFGDDHAYMEQIRQMLEGAGFTKALLYTADGPEELKNGTLPDLPAVINFGPGEAKQGFEQLKQLRPQGPLMTGEFWAGWFDHWGGKHASTDTALQARELKWMLDQGYSVSIYMFHGGTSFGWMNGANSNGKNYEPDVTSYDYDSALDESGRPTAKYQALREAIGTATGVALSAVPQVKPPLGVPAFPLAETVSLWNVLPRPVHSEQPLTMEDLDQSYGYILYRTKLAGPMGGELALNDLHDYAQVYLDGKLVGTLDRRLGQHTMALTVSQETARFDILVENTGRVNFTAVLRGERKGITRSVTLAGQPITGWDIYSLPMEHPETLPYKAAPCDGPCFYRGHFSTSEAADTFLDTVAFTKGQVWLNGQALGRVWNIGPQRTLYAPGCWLKSQNEVIVFDLRGGDKKTVTGLTKPILDAKPGHGVLQ
jgi:beta-galactosidase